MITRTKTLAQYHREKLIREGKPLFSFKRPPTGQKLKTAPRPGTGLQSQQDGQKRARAPLKKQSRARQREMTQYYDDRREFLRAHPACGICLCLDQTPRQATEVHHSRGRIGRLLLDQRFWVPSCRPCREIPHNRPNWAREMGLLASATDWNTVPR